MVLVFLFETLNECEAVNDNARVTEDEVVPPGAVND